MQQVEIREAVTFLNEGQKLFGILHVPLHTEQQVPGIIFCPGFAGNKSGKHRLFVTLAQELAKRGFAVLRFDYRGAGDSEGDFHSITLEGHVSDTLKALDFLTSFSYVDPSRLGILGRSLGGAIAVLTASRFKRIKSLALWAPVFESRYWQELWQLANKPPLSGFQKSAMKLIPSILPNPQFLKQFFALHLQDELLTLQDTPLLHIHGEKDPVVGIEHAEAYQKYRPIDSVTRFVRLAHSDHDFSDPDEQKIAIEETCQWFEKTVR